MRSEWEWIDLRGRTMMHPPWGGPSPAFPMPARVLSRILSAFEQEGGSRDKLCAMLSAELPAQEFRLLPGEIVLPERAYSLEYYFYLFTFAKIILNNPRFRFRGDEDGQLERHHRILEDGTMRRRPWLGDDEENPDGYLSIANMRAMFIYLETAAPLPPCADALRPTDYGAQVSAFALECLNRCAPPEYRVERSFFDREEMIISFEYLYYISSIMELLTNDNLFVYNSLYFGFRSSSLLARTIFLQPSLSPAEGLRRWQSRTNSVYRLDFRSRGRNLWIDVNLRNLLQTGMFGAYRARCVDGIRQACPAVYGAFIELATCRPVKTRITAMDDDGGRFTILIRWKTPPERMMLLPAGIACAAAAAAAVALDPGPATALAGAAAAALGWLAFRNGRRLKALEGRFSETRKVIDRQFETLKERSRALLLERDTLENKVQERTAELEEALARLRELDEAKTNFIANVSHELRTPLTLLSVPLQEIMEGRHGETVPADDPVFALMERNARRLGGQIGQLLDFSRLDLGTMPFAPEPVDLPAFCRSLLAELSSLAERKGIALELENSCPHEELRVEADPALLETALLNLLNNALKFTDRGEVRVTIEPPEQGEGVLLTVRDTGIGFNASEKERIFQRFTQAEEHRARRFEGAGLGLALTAEIVKRHGWSITAEGEPGRGAAFRIHLPACAPAEAPGAGAVLDAAKIEAGAGEEKELILVVEDNTDMGTVLTGILEPAHSVRWCRGGAEALGFLDGEPDVALIICDVMMPGMNGFEFRTLLRKDPRWKDIPFIFLTALAGPEEQLQGLGQGALDYISKPFSREELLYKIQTILAVRRARYLDAVRDMKAARRLSQSGHWSADSDGPASVIAECGITPAEERVLALLRRGMQDKEIAEALSLSVKTVSSHLGSIYRKTGTGNRTELISRIYSRD